MTGQQLKNSILQLAIQGKLVPQIESEGTAEDLLKEIRAERNNKIKRGEIKLSKPEKGIKLTKNHEFDIPDSWTWCVLSDVCRVFGRIGFRGYTKEDLVREKEGAISLSPSNMKDNGLVFDNCTYISWEKYEESPEIKIQEEDILIVKTGSSYGKTSLVKNLPWKSTINPQIAVIKDITINRNFLKYLLDSPYCKNLYETFVLGTSIPTFSQLNLLSMNIPLPPLSEQKRIVSKIEEMMPLVEEYGKAQEKLEALNRELPEKLKKSVLQEAIMGKLVPQDPTEGTAEELLAEIRKEKEKLVKEGKLKKKDLEVKPIEDDEIPFEIPEGWRWVRGRFLFAPMQSIKPQGETFKYIDIDAIDNKRNEHIVKNIITFNAPSRASRKTQKGDILFSMVRPYLKNIAIVKEDDCIASTGFFVCRPYIIDIQYCFRMLLSSYVIDGLTNDFMKGDNSPSINNDDFLNYLFPLPPLAEQKRIVAKMEEVMEMIEGMKK